VLLGMTDSAGNFEIQFPPDKEELLVSFIGMEWTSIKVPSNCNYLEIIMMNDANYDFMSIRKENKNRSKRVKSLQTKHHQAHENGTFNNNAPCFTYIFKKY
jgi:hypothetical protein